MSPLRPKVGGSCPPRSYGGAAHGLDAAYCYRRGVVCVWMRSITTDVAWSMSGCGLLLLDVAWCVSGCSLLLQTWLGVCVSVCGLLLQTWHGLCLGRPIATCVAWCVCRSALRRVLRLARVLCRRRRCHHRRCRHRRFSPSRPSRQNLRNQPSPNDLSCTFGARVVKAHKLRRSVVSSTLYSCQTGHVGRLMQTVAQCGVVFM